MLRSTFTRSAAPVAAVATALLLAAGCGDVKVTADSQKKSDSTSKATPSDSASASPAAVDTSAGRGTWLLGLQAAGGADAETSTTTYVTYDPSTGQATAHALPGVQAGSASPEEAGLLVSADRQWAIPDTEISHGEETSGKLKVYSLSTGNAKVVDIRQRSGKNDVKAIGWAFDPQRADTLRVVDTANRIWTVNVAGGKAVQEGSLPKGPWVFTNGFNRNTGEPWVESIDSDATKPAGNGPADRTPISRDGGTVLPSGSEGLTRLPASPCRLAAGFTEAGGVTWVFCADSPTLSTYYLPKDGTAWTAYGKPSAPVAPTAAGFSLVLPPAT